jgi:hypothetical protein
MMEITFRHAMWATAFLALAGVAACGMPRIAQAPTASVPQAALPAPDEGAQRNADDKTPVTPKPQN